MATCDENCVNLSDYYFEFIYLPAELKIKAMKVVVMFGDLIMLLFSVEIILKNMRLSSLSLNSFRKWHQEITRLVCLSGRAFILLALS